MFCPTNCTNTCILPCNIHPHTYTLTPYVANKINQNILENIQEPPKPPKEMMNLQKNPITLITNKKSYENKDKYGSIPKISPHKNANGTYQTIKSTLYGYHQSQ
jgi:hypothetical protein